MTPITQCLQCCCDEEGISQRAKAIYDSYATEAQKKVQMAAPFALH